MTTNYPRRTIDYPVFGINTYSAVLAQNGFVEISCPSGPGEFLWVSSIDWNLSSALYYDMHFHMTIDGLAIIDSVWRDVLLMPLNYDSHSLFAFNEISLSPYQASAFAVKAPYESSCVIRFINPVAGNLAIAGSVCSRRGA